MTAVAQSSLVLQPRTCFAWQGLAFAAPNFCGLARLKINVRRRGLSEPASMDSSQLLANLSALFQGIQDKLTWLPSWFFGPALVGLALVVALILHSILVAIIRRMVGPRRMFLGLLLSRTKGPTRLALLILATAAALRFAPLSSELAAALSQGLTIAFTILVGWTALIAIDLATTQYLLRFRLDTEDNLLARKHVTQVRILKRSADTLAVIVTIAFSMMTFEQVRQYGVSLFASAGVAGIVAGLAARPVLSNLLAGIQIAMTQPIRIEDAVIVEGEFGWVEEISSAYVVLRLWDLRRMVVPLSYFIEKPFQNWTRQSSAMLGSIILEVDYTAPVDRIRDKLNEIVHGNPLWDGKVVSLQVTDCKTSTMELRALVSARSSGTVFDLRCQVREKLIAFLQQEHPGALPRQRADVAMQDLSWPKEQIERQPGTMPTPSN
jgi:small-conductance mechanosensitive channel